MFGASRDTEAARRIDGMERLPCVTHLQICERYRPMLELIISNATLVFRHSRPRSPTGTRHAVPEHPS